MWQWELQEGLRAVREGCRIAVRVRRVAQESFSSKADNTPVTVADIALQTSVFDRLGKTFPSDNYIGEESSATFDSEPGVEAKVGQVLKEEGSSLTRDAIRAALDRGRGNSMKGRVWALDPIDGTKGFVGDGQYAVALAFLVDGVVELGIIGCPALPDSMLEDSSAVGSVFYAVRGQGSRSASLVDGTEHSIRTDMDAPIRLLEAAEGKFTSYAHSAFAASMLGWSEPPVRMDSCCKYALIARGEACAFLKQPKTPYTEKLWDHAAGVLLVKESGGIVTDGDGLEFDFTVGRELRNNRRGIIAAASPSLHQALLEAMRMSRTALGDTKG